MAVAVLLECAAVQKLVGFSFDVVIDVVAAFAQHGLALRLHRLHLKVEVGEAVGFKSHGELELLGGQVLVVLRPVGAGARVVLCARSFEELVDGAGFVVLRRQEHQVLKEVGEARLSTNFVAASHAEPRLKAHHGCALVFERQDGETIG